MTWTPPEASGPASQWIAAERVEVDLQTGYRLWSEVYDAEYNPLIAVEKREVERILAGLRFADVLDAGTGTGRWSLRLAEMGARVTGIDGSPEMLAKASAKAAAAGLDIRFDQGRIDALPYEDESFDLVTCALVLSHLEELADVMAEFARVLRPGGSVLVTDFHPDIVTAGGRAEFQRDGVRYLLPNPERKREDYLAALHTAALDVIEATDIPVKAIPAGQVKQLFLDLFGDCDLCLILLARKA